MKKKRLLLTALGVLMMLFLCAFTNLNVNQNKNGLPVNATQSFAPVINGRTDLVYNKSGNSRNHRTVWTYLDTKGFEIESVEVNSSKLTSDMYEYLPDGRFAIFRSAFSKSPLQALAPAVTPYSIVITTKHGNVQCSLRIYNAAASTAVIFGNNVQGHDNARIFSFSLASNEPYYFRFQVGQSAAQFTNILSPVKLYKPDGTYINVTDKVTWQETSNLRTGFTLSAETLKTLKRGNYLITIESVSNIDYAVLSVRD